jgi:hypothetical protein
MKILLGLMAIFAALMAVAVLSIVQMLIKLAPVLIVVGVVILVLRVIRRRSQPGPATVATALPPGRSVAQPAAALHPGGWAPTTPPPGGWVFMPVWVGPAPHTPSRAVRRPVIDTEVIEDDRYA